MGLWFQIVYTNSFTWFLHGDMLCVPLFTNKGVCWVKHSNGSNWIMEPNFWKCFVMIVGWHLNTNMNDPIGMIGSNEKVSHRVEWWTWWRFAFVEMQSSIVFHGYHHHANTWLLVELIPPAEEGVWWSTSSFFTLL
jgi:hypothetical protein